MKLSDLIEQMGFQIRSGDQNLDAQVHRGYASDLLSDVLAHANSLDLWVTLQTHANIVAVASMKGLAGITLVNGREPEDETLSKAQSEGIPILVSELSAFECVGRLYALGIKGMDTQEE